MIELTNRCEFSIGSRIHKVDCVRNPILYRKLDSVDVITESGAQCADVGFNTFGQFWREIIRVMNVLLAREVRLARIVSHDHDFLLTYAIASDELLEVNRLLERHAQRSGFVVLGPEFFK